MLALWCRRKKFRCLRHADVADHYRRSKTEETEAAEKFVTFMEQADNIADWVMMSPGGAGQQSGGEYFDVER